METSSSRMWKSDDRFVRVSRIWRLTTSRLVSSSEALYCATTALVVSFTIDGKTRSAKSGFSKELKTRKNKFVITRYLPVPSCLYMLGSARWSGRYKTRNEICTICRSRHKKVVRKPTTHYSLIKWFDVIDVMPFV